MPNSYLSRFLWPTSTHIPQDTETRAQGVRQDMDMDTTSGLRRVKASSAATPDCYYLCVYATSCVPGTGSMVLPSRSMKSTSMSEIADLRAQLQFTRRVSR